MQIAKADILCSHNSVFHMRLLFLQYIWFLFVRYGFNAVL